MINDVIIFNVFKYIFHSNSCTSGQTLAVVEPVMVAVAVIVIHSD